MMNKTVILCMGTRPEIIKMAPIYHALKRTNLTPLVLHTGQHDTLAEALYPFFNMKPDYKFSMTHDSSSLGHLFSLTMDNLDNLFGRIKTAAVLVQGDTSTALAGALAAFYHKIPVGHIEAGLRSHSDYEPFPEEKNRELIARLSQWHFVPTPQAMNNLLNEGIEKNRCFLVGNSIVDSVNWTLKHIESSSYKPATETQKIMQWLDHDREDHKTILVTAHRRESWQGQIKDIAKGIRAVTEQHPDIRVIWPVHPNPVVRNAVQDILKGLDECEPKQVWLCKPVNCPDMLYFLQHSWLVLTDSGGLQEEAVTLKIPVLVLRDKTERPEVTEVHGGALIGTAPHSISGWVNKLYDEKQYKMLKSTSNPFGDGHTATAIVKILENDLIKSNVVDLTAGVN